MIEPSLLPRNATLYEKAISEAVAAWWDVDPSVLSTLWDPWRCPESVLPFLAAGLSVDLWNPRWPLAKRRRVTARSIPLSRARGVRSTFAEYLDIIDAELVEFLVPPQGLFPRRHWTDEERTAWRAKFPEIRVYPCRNRHIKPRNLLIVGQPWFGGRSILRKSVAPQYAGRRATYVKDSVETPVNIRVNVGTGDFARGLFTIALPTTERRLILPATLGKRFIPRKSTAHERVYVYAHGTGRHDLLPPSKPIAIEPDRIGAPHVVRGGFYIGHTLPMILRSSRAKEFVYDSVRVYDPAEARAEGPPRNGGWILGRSKLRQKPFTIHIKADLSRRRPGGFVVGHSLPMIARNFDNSRLLEGLAAVRAAKIGRDRTMVSTALHREIRPGEDIRPDGTFRVGEVIRAP